MVELGTPAPDFALEDTDGRIVRRDDFSGKPLLVMFLCNHCPYVQHIADRLPEVAAQAQGLGVGVVGINSNDIEAFPEDSPEEMAKEALHRGYPFPYLFDATQEVARAYEAACTPDFFLYDRGHRLVYRGQFDDARPGNDRPVTGATLLEAVEAVVAETALPRQVPSLGCNIKWKAS